jgi:hypothetical protein
MTVILWNECIRLDAELQQWQATAELAEKFRKENDERAEAAESRVAELEEALKMALHHWKSYADDYWDDPSDDLDTSHGEGELYRKLKSLADKTREP